VEYEVENYAMEDLIENSRIFWGQRMRAGARLRRIIPGGGPRGRPPVDDGLAEARAQRRKSNVKVARVARPISQVPEKIRNHAHPQEVQRRR
jgi:hypothetical protein